MSIQFTGRVMTNSISPEGRLDLLGPSPNVYKARATAVGIAVDGSAGSDHWADPNNTMQLVAMLQATKFDKLDKERLDIGNSVQWGESPPHNPKSQQWISSTGLAPLLPHFVEKRLHKHSLNGADRGGSLRSEFTDLLLYVFPFYVRPSHDSLRGSERADRSRTEL